MAIPKAIVLQKNNVGQLRIRADMDVAGQFGNHTISRQMEGKLPIEQVNRMAAEFDALFTWIDDNGVPTE